MDLSGKLMNAEVFEVDISGDVLVEHFSIQGRRVVLASIIEVTFFNNRVVGNIKTGYSIQHPSDTDRPKNAEVQALGRLIKKTEPDVTSSTLKEDGMSAFELFGHILEAHTENMLSKIEDILKDVDRTDEEYEELGKLKDKYIQSQLRELP